jgi:colanic acid/amylovoran biosynthesis protein
LRELHESDFVGEIRGGDSFSDIYGLRQFLFGSLTSIIAILLGKQLVLLPQTYGPYDSGVARSVAKYIVRRSAVVLCRYRDGVSAIKHMLGSNSSIPVRFCPDVAFMLDSLKPENPKISPPLQQDAMSPLIGININGLMYNGGYTQGNMFGLKFDYKEMALKMMVELLEKTDVNLLLIPHTFGPPGNINSDPDASRDVINALPKEYKARVHMVMDEYDQSEIKGIIGMCDFLIGSRMHACIAALSQGIPTAGIAYSHKFIGVFDSIGSGETVIDARSLDMDTVIQKVMTAFENREALSADTKETVAAAQQKIMATFKELL